MFSILRARILLFLSLVVLLAGVAVSRDAVAAPLLVDTAGIQAGMTALIAHLDSPAYAAAVTWEEHIVLAYQVAQQRPPTPLEFVFLNLYRQQEPVSRSFALSVALRGDALALTWEQCATFLQRADLSDWVVTLPIRVQARALAQVPSTYLLAAMQPQLAHVESAPAAMPAALAEPYTEYNVYYGYFHAHSELSDGEGDPLDDYIYARDQGGLDYFSLTDHGELLLIWPWQNKWQELKDAAQATYAPGQFATLWGFEWSNPILGHVNVLNTDDYTNALSDFGIIDLYDYLIARPEAFARFNHPGRYDLLFIEFLHLRLHAAAVPQMVGIENFNKNDGFDEYYYGGSWFTDDSYYDVGNRKGWYLGALGGQDNHSVDYGTRNEFRTAVLAQTLTREAIADAYRQRRFYATEDKDLELDFRYQGYPMGTRLTGQPGGPRVFDIAACDGSGDTFQEARLYRNGAQIAVQSVSGNCFQTTLTDPNPAGANYYYIIVRQTDDNDANGRPDEALSSPIWIE